jgi:multidrug efflux pump subunit AcrB
MERKMTREERYRNVKIDDMLSGQAQGKNYGITAIDQYKKNKAEQKQTMRSLFIAMGFVAIVILVFLGYFFLGF